MKKLIDATTDFVKSLTCLVLDSRAYMAQAQEIARKEREEYALMCRAPVRKMARKRVARKK